MGGNHFVQNWQNEAISVKARGGGGSFGHAVSKQTHLFWCFCETHKEALDNGMGNLTTLDAVGESLSLQIKLSSHLHGAPYKMGGAREMNLGLGFWVIMG